MIARWWPRDAAARWWRHVALGAFVAGLLLAPLCPPASVPVAILSATLLGRRATAVVAVVAVGLGLALGVARLAAIDRAALPPDSGAVIDEQAVVLESPRPRADGSRHGRVRLRRGGVAVAIARAPMAIGEIVHLRGIVRPLGPGDAYQRARGARAAVEVWTLTSTGRRRGGIAGALDTARRRAETALTARLPPAAGALARGMVLGQDEALPRDLRDSFQASGLAHLLAASGQNVMLLCLLVFGVSALAGVPLRLRLASALALVALYVPLAGGGPSIQRAGVMGAAAIVATLAGRPASRWYALLLAAAVTLLLNPRAAAEPGWQLSFAAVIGLLAWVPRLRRRIPGPTVVVEAVAVTVAATAATAPLLALHFGQVSLASLPANLLAAPAVAPLMWVGMAGTAVAQFWASGGAWIASLCGPFVGFVAWVALTAASVPGAAGAVAIGVPAVVAVYAAAVALTLCRPRGLRHARDRTRALLLAPLALVALWLGLRAGPDVPPRAPGELVVSFLDVGQGDATLLQVDGTAVLFDTGPPGGPILRRLDEAGVHRLDALVVTHAQADHEGMAPEIVDRVPTRLLLNGGAGWPTPTQARLARGGGNARVIAAHAGQRLRLGGLDIRLLWPPAGAAREGDPNVSAVVAHVRVGAFDLLLPADAESEVTARLDLPRVEALKVAHHGSEDSGLPRLLERLSPRVAAIEVGRGNRYGHPRPSTLRALRAVPLLARTDRDGTVRLHVRSGRMWLESGGRVW